MEVIKQSFLIKAGVISRDFSLSTQGVVLLFVVLIFFVFQTCNFFLQLIWLKKNMTDNFLVKTMGVTEFLV